MKKLSLLLLICVTEPVFAQNTFLKAGADVGFNYQSSTQYGTGFSYPPSWGLNLGYEKSLGKKTTFQLNLNARHYISNETWGGADFTRSLISISFVPEFRYYVFKNKGQVQVNYQGLFLQTGLNVMSFNWATSEYAGHTFAYNYFAVAGSQNWNFEIPFGLGLKYNLKQTRGMEMNISTDLYSQVVGNRWQSIRVGIKYYWLNKNEKPKTWLEEKEEKLKPEAPSSPKESYWKAGLAVNSTFMMDKGHGYWDLHYPTYPSLQLSYEKTVGKRSAFVLNLESMVKSLEFRTENNEIIREARVAQISFIPEYRFYLRNKYIRGSLNSGFYLQLGFELFHYATWTYGEMEGHGFDLYPAGLNGYWERNVPIGFGLKCPLKNNQGLEINLNTNIMQIINQGYDQTFSLGVKYFWLRKKTQR